MEWVCAQVRAWRRYFHAPGMKGAVDVEVFVSAEVTGMDQEPIGMLLRELINK